MIDIKQLSKHFRVYRGNKGRLRASMGLAREGRDYDVVKSLHNLNLHVPEGAVHGIIGMNGAGKSTLLKLLAGVIEPTSGSFHLQGRVAALLELGTGFHPDMTGRQNVETNGSLLGFRPREIKAKMMQIEDFAELGAFFDRPVKTYSSGMYVRLAFSFAIAVEPQVLIIDEALSVGDAYFQQKCLEEINRFKNGSTTILFVSHDLAAIKLLCDQVSLLAHGELIFTGSALDALDRYNALLAKHQDSHRNPQKALAALEASNPKGSTFMSGSGEISIKEVGVITRDGQQVEAVVSGDKVRISVHSEVNADQLENPTCGILIRDRLGYDVFGTNSSFLAQRTGSFKRGDQPIFTFEMALHLGPGDYSITVALHSSTSHVEKNYAWRDRALMIRVLPNTDFTSIGVARLFPTFDVLDSRNT